MLFNQALNKAFQVVVLVALVLLVADTLKVF
jgi:hypothetical protein